jgi:hypothetical protein
MNRLRGDGINEDLEDLLFCVDGWRCGGIVRVGPGTMSLGFDGVVRSFVDAGSFGDEIPHSERDEHTG